LVPDRLLKDMQAQKLALRGARGSMPPQDRVMLNEPPPRPEQIDDKRPKQLEYHKHRAG